MSYAGTNGGGHRFERAVGALTILLPTLGTCAAALLTAMHGLRMWQLALLAATYTVTLVAVEVGYHRMIVHRGFETHPILRALFASVGSMGTIGPIGWWTANHRQHHEFTEEPGDPHSPHLSGATPWGKLRGFWHSHAGWLLRESSIITDPARYSADVYRDPVLRTVHRFYFPLVLLGLLIPAGIGALFEPTWYGFVSGLLWGGFVRMFCVHHAVWALGSICHSFGSQDYESRDQARNNALVALLTFGEGWHHNHHVFPSSARHGLEWWQLDPNYYLIRTLEVLGLVWNVKTPTPHAKARRRKRPVQNVLTEN